MKFAGAVICAALVVNGCAGGAPPPVSQTARDRIAQCGAGIKVGSAIELKLMSRQDQQSLSAELSSQIRAAIFDKVAVVDRLYVYDRYVACVTAQRDVDTIVADLPVKKATLASILAEDEYPKPEVNRILAFFDAEEAQLRALKILDARETHRQRIEALVTMVVRKKGNILSVSPLLSNDPPEFKFAATGTFANLCRTASGDDPICKIQIDRLIGLREPCDLDQSMIGHLECQRRGREGIDGTDEAVIIPRPRG